VRDGHGQQTVRGVENVTVPLTVPCFVTLQPPPGVYAALDASAPAPVAEHVVRTVVDVLVQLVVL
jgi:hypothetical protein